MAVSSLAAALLSTSTATASGAPPLSRSFGYNLSQSLINPSAEGASETDLRREVAAILYDVRMGGGQVVRWMVTDVWRQWRCGLNPVDPATGALDPAWSTVVRVLMEQAAAQNVRVVVTLANVTNDRFDAAAGWAVTGSKCNGSNVEPVDKSATALFQSSAARDRLGRDLAKMTRVLVGYPALAAIELFNEPPFEFTKTAAYWSLVSQMRDAVLGASPAAATIPTFSGTAAWGPEIVSAAQRSGELAREALVTVHSYPDYRDPGRDGTSGLLNLVSYVRQILPGKPLVIAETGSGKNLATLAEHRAMLETIRKVYLSNDIGMWVWGNLSSEDGSDLRVDFNPASIAGVNFRPHFFADREALYASPRRMTGIDPRTRQQASVTFHIRQLPGTSADPARRGAWMLSLNGQTFLGVARGGVFSQPDASASSHFGVPPSTVFLSERDAASAWVEIGQAGPGWKLSLFSCDSAAGNGAAATPDVILGLAAERHREDLMRCTKSTRVFVGNV